MRDFSRLDAFLDQRLDDIYPEPTGNVSEIVIEKMVPDIISHYGIQTGAKVLDVGCGNGLALQAFRLAGCDPIGIGFGKEAQMCRDEGFEIIEQDMSFLDFPEQKFDVVWCRHVLEHSIIPFFTLSEMFRILKPGGVFYMEVPSPGTSSKHETNPNHYSVLTQEMWLSLIQRIGYRVVRSNKFLFKTPVGEDAYFLFDSQKP